MKSQTRIQQYIKKCVNLPQVYELGLGLFLISFILTSLLLWQHVNPVVVQPTYYAVDSNGQLTPVAATIERSPTEVMGESVHRESPDQ